MSVELRPRSIGEILDTSFRLVVRNLGTWALIVLVGVAPITLFSALDYVSTGSAVVDLFAILLLLAGLVGWSVALGGLTWALDRTVQDRLPGVGEALGRGLRMVVRTFVITLLTYLAAVVSISVVVFLAFVMGGVVGFFNGIAGVVLGLALLLAGGVWMLRIVVPRVFLALPCAIAEDIGALAGFRRAAELARGGERDLVILFITTYVLVFLPSMAIGFLVAFVGSVADPTSAVGVLPVGWFVAQQGLSLLTAIFTTPLLAAVTVLAYYDRRVSLEGYDVESAADSLSE